jgi:Flp pilus assembly protein TadG
MRRRIPFVSGDRGASAVEFALLAPVLFGFIIAISQLGMLFFADAGLKSAVGAAARFATIFPRPSDSQIKSKIADSRFGLDPARLSAATTTYGSANGRDFVEIQISYQVPLNLVFYTTAPITLSETRRVYVFPD